MLCISYFGVCSSCFTPHFVCHISRPDLVLRSVVTKNKYKVRNTKHQELSAENRHEERLHACCWSGGACSYQQRVHQRWFAFLSSSEYPPLRGMRLTTSRSSSVSSDQVFIPRFSQRGQPFLSLILNYSFMTNLIIYWSLSPRVT